MEVKKGIIEELVARGYIEQLTHEDEIKKLFDKEILF